ncbi:hypothetical protein V6N13_107685 [Hibiscus sabdariffa]
MSSDSATCTKKGEQEPQPESEKKKEKEESFTLCRRKFPAIRAPNDESQRSRSLPREESQHTLKPRRSNGGRSRSAVGKSNVQSRFREDQTTISQIGSEKVKELDESYWMVSLHG